MEANEKTRRLLKSGAPLHDEDWVGNIGGVHYGKSSHPVRSRYRPAGLVGVALLASRSIAQAPPAPGSVTYRYDSLGRVVQDIYPAKSAAYDYDAAGNWVTFTLN